jgi:hypothetical protein
MLDRHLGRLIETIPERPILGAAAWFAALFFCLVDFAHQGTSDQQGSTHDRGRI